jgi:hypothetical protein
MKKSKYILLIIALIFISCDEEFLEEDPKSFIASSNFYQTDDQAISGINAAYGSLRNEGVRLEFIYMDDVSADDLVPTPGQPNDRLQLDRMVYTSEHAYLYTMWKNQYQGINRANTALTQLEDGNISTTLAKRLEGEARFLRAFYHFRLVRWFGDVPLMTEDTRSAEESELYPSRTPSAEVYAQIIEDLKFAEENLNDKYEYGNPDYYRATKGSAKALLAKVYLTMAGYPLNDELKWQLAKEKSQEIIDNKAKYGYELVDNIADIFNVNKEASNTEQIWSLPATTGLSVNGWYYTRMKRYFITWTSIRPTNEVLGTSEYSSISIWDDPNDLRRKAALATKSGSGITDVDSVGVKVVGKYWDAEQDAYARNDYPYIRFSEVYYILAEAIVETGGDLDRAMDIINMFRTRAGVAPLSYTDANDIRQIIHDEKRKEFLFEGKRRSDLIRWGEYVDAMIAHGERQFGPGNLNEIGHTGERNTLFPLPLTEFIANKNLRPQNFDY